MNATAIETPTVKLPFLPISYYPIYDGDPNLQDYMKSMVSYCLIAEKKYGVLEDSYKIIRDLIAPSGAVKSAYTTQYATHRRIIMAENCKKLFNDNTPIGIVIKKQYELKYEKIIDETGNLKRTSTGEHKFYNYQTEFKLPSRFTVTFNDNNIFYNNARFTINERILNNVTYSKYSIELLKEIENITFEFILNETSEKYEINQVMINEELQNKQENIQPISSIKKEKKIKHRVVLTNSHISLLQNIIGPLFNNKSSEIFSLIKHKYFTSFIKYINLSESKLYSILIKEERHVKPNYLNKDMIKIELPTIIYYIVDELRKTNCKIELYNIKAYLENKVYEDTFKIIDECFNEEENKILRMIQCYA